MDIFEIARKLEPIKPELVNRWRSHRDFATASLRVILDRELSETARRVLGNIDKNLLLSLPPERLIQGRLKLGEVIYGGEKWPAGIAHSELLQHIVVLGRSGAGKSNFAFNLLDQLTNDDAAWIFFDWKKTARHFLPSLRKSVQLLTPGRALSPIAFNPFAVPPAVEKDVYTNQLVDAMSAAYMLGVGARTILRRAFAVCYSTSSWPSVSDVINALEAMKLKSRENEWRITAARALESMKHLVSPNASIETQKTVVERLINSRTIVEMDGLESEGRKFLIPMLCLWIYQYRLQQPDREKLKLTIFVEEAHHTLYRQEHRSKESIMDALIRQSREVGIAFVIIDQHPHLLSSASLGNAFTKICLNLSDPTDINKAAGLCLLRDDDKINLSKLPVGQAIVKLQDRWLEPFLIRIPHASLNKGRVSDEMLLESFRDSRDSRLISTIFPEPERIRESDSFLKPVELAFLEDVHRYQHDAVTTRYTRLGLSGQRGNGVKNCLLRTGWLVSEIIPQEKTRRLELRISNVGRSALGLDRNLRRQGSISHEYWKSFYSRRCTELGYEVVLEARRLGGQVDVLATKDNQRIGIEIETGKSNYVENVKNGLRSRFTTIVVVVTDKSVYNKIFSTLAREGLLLPTRVLVVSAGDVIEFTNSPRQAA